MARRPKAGDIVSYEISKDKNGKSRAVAVRFSVRSQPKKQLPGKRQNSSLPVLFSMLFICTLFVTAYCNRISWWVVITYSALSLVTFFVYGWDKSSARLGNWRTAESTLHFMALIGGWPGALAAQRLLRHKSSKQQFLSVFWVTVLLNMAAVGYLMWSGETGFINQLIDGAFKSL